MTPADLRRLETRIRLLERGRTVPVIHQACTSIPVGDTANDLVATHESGEAGRPWMVPLELPGVLQAAVVQSVVAAASEKAAWLAVGLYRADNPSEGSKADLLAGNLPLAFRLVAQARPLYVSSDTPSVATWQLDREVTLDPNAQPQGALFFVGYTAEDDAAAARWFVPGAAQDWNGTDDTPTLAPHQGLRTAPPGGTSTDLPVRCWRESVVRAPPVSFVVRSLVGHQIRGGTT